MFVFYLLLRCPRGQQWLFKLLHDLILSPTTPGHIGATLSATPTLPYGVVVWVRSRRLGECTRRRPLRGVRRKRGEVDPKALRASSLRPHSPALCESKRSPRCRRLRRRLQVPTKAYNETRRRRASKALSDGLRRQIQQQRRDLWASG